MVINKYKFLLGLAILIGAVVHFFEVLPTLTDSVRAGTPLFSVMVAPDSWTYINVAATRDLSDLIGDRNFNIIGPVSLLWLAQESITLVALVNVIVFALAVRAVHSSTGIRAAPFTLLLLVNPMIFISLLAPNKEALIVSSLLFAAAYGASRHAKYIVFAILAALFAKIELVAVLALFYFFVKVKEKHALLLFVLFGLTLIYPMLPGVDFRVHSLVSGQNEESFGLIMFIHQISYDYFLYVLAVIPRVLLNIFDGFLTMLRLRDVNEMLLYIPILSSGALIVISMLLVVKKFKLRWSDETVLLIIVFCLFASLVPFVHHRYIMPIYPLLVILLMRPKELIVDGRRMGLGTTKEC